MTLLQHIHANLNTLEYNLDHALPRWDVRRELYADNGEKLFFMLTQVGWVKDLQQVYSVLNSHK